MSGLLFRIGVWLVITVLLEFITEVAKVVGVSVEVAEWANGYLSAVLVLALVPGLIGAERKS